jgi:hypothetical protein
MYLKSGVFVRLHMVRPGRIIFFNNRLMMPERLFLRCEKKEQKNNAGKYTDNRLCGAGKSIGET